MPRKHERPALFNIERDCLSVNVCWDGIDDGRTGIVCSVDFELNGEERYLKFMVISGPGEAVFVERVGGGGPFPGQIIGQVRDFAKVKIASYLNEAGEGEE